MVMQTPRDVRRRRAGIITRRAARGRAQGRGPYRLHIDANSELGRLETAIFALRDGTSRRNIRSTIARDLAANIQRFCPVDTGALRQSILVFLSTRGITISMLFYGRFLDQGTSRIRPRYFVQRGIQATVRGLRNLLGRTQG